MERCWRRRRSEVVVSRTFTSRELVRSQRGCGVSQLGSPPALEGRSDCSVSALVIQGLAGSVMVARMVMVVLVVVVVDVVVVLEPLLLLLE